MRNICSLCLLFCVVAAPVAFGQSYFYVGAAGGDFYDENNWDTNPAALPGSGVAGSLMFDVPTNPLFNSSTAQILIDLIIDGDTVVAGGVVDIGNDDPITNGYGGSLTMTAGSSLSAVGDFDYNQGAGLLDITGGSITATDDIIIQAESASLTGGAALTADDNIQFENEMDSLIIDGATLTTTGLPAQSAARVWFDMFADTLTGVNGTHSISNLTVNSYDDFGIRFGLNLTVSDSDINLGIGQDGQLENVFGSDDPVDPADRLTLLGASTLVGQSVESGVDLGLGGTSVATLAGNGLGEILQGNDNGGNTSRILFQSVDAILNVSGAITTDPRALIKNDFTGNSYATNPEEWNIENWNGLDAISGLQIDVIPEPSSIVIFSVCLAVAGTCRRRS